MSDPTRPDPTDAGSTDAGHLSLWDATSIIIGIVIGTTIFKLPQVVAQNVSGPGQLMGAWLLGGLLALVGALCYAELTAAYPRSGGDYVYLTRAFGPWVGFLFGWAQLAAILTGSIGAMAYALADYAKAFLGVSTPDTEFYVRWAAGSVVLMTALNVLGVIVGKTAQNALSLLKLVSLGAIVLVGLVRAEYPASEEPQPMTGAGFGLAMVFILYAYGGWNDAAFVASEVRDRRRNLPRALFLGTGGIMCIYLLVNLGYLFGLGFEGLRQSDAPAADLLSHRLGAWGGRVMSLIVMISALGAINGLIFAGSRVFATMGRDHRLFSWLGQWNERQHVPYGSLIIQAAVTIALIFAVGTPGGRDTVDRGLSFVGQEVDWKRFAQGPNDYSQGFEALVAATAPVFWSFFLLSGLSLFALREIDPDAPRPFKVPGYPFTPFVFCLTSVYMLYSSVTYAGTLCLLGLIPVAMGLPLYAVSRMMDKRASARMSAE